MIQTLAQVYVNVLEPAFKVFLIVLVVLFILYVFNLLRGGDKKNDLATMVVNTTVKFLVNTVKLIGSLTWKGLKALLNIISLISATLRDFFTSKI